MRVSAILLLLTASLFAAPPAWKPANFRGVVIGQGRRQEIVRLLGTPDDSLRTRSGEELTYRARGDHKGDLTVRLAPSGVVVEVQEAFPVAIPRTQIYKEFGRDPLTAHFSRAKCASNALYRNQCGAIELTLYPSLGIILWPDQNGYDFAAILFTAKQPGLNRPPACVGTVKH